MIKLALYITAPTTEKDYGADGYMNALARIGWNTLKYHAQTKIEIRNLIINHNLCLIFTTSKYGVRQLPIDAINEYGVCVVIKPLLFIEDDTDLLRLKEIENRIQHLQSKI